MLNMLDFRGRKIIVAGVGGIGFEVAKMLNSLGAELVVVDVSKENLQATLSNLGLENKQGYCCDFSDVPGIEVFVQQIVQENGCFDGFVYCVGVGSVRPLKMSNYKFMREVMDINFFSFVEMVRCLSKKGNCNPKGMNVVGISALGAFLGNSTKTAYCASKGAMNAAVRCMAKELSVKNIRVNVVAPGVTDTVMAKEAGNYGSDSEEHKLILKRQYLGMCSPLDVANAVVFLLSDMSKMITGNCIPVDGGKLSS